MLLGNLETVLLTYSYKKFNSPSRWRGDNSGVSPPGGVSPFITSVPSIHFSFLTSLNPPRHCNRISSILYFSQVYLCPYAIYRLNYISHWPSFSLISSPTACFMCSPVVEYHYTITPEKIDIYSKFFKLETKKLSIPVVNSDNYKLIFFLDFSKRFFTNRLHLQVNIKHVIGDVIIVTKLCLRAYMNE